MHTRLVIGSRGSRLAMWQSEWVARRLEAAHPGLTVEIRIIKTTGDKLAQASLAQIAGKGVFTKELEDALLEGTTDLAVHSLKDLPTRLPDGLHVGAVPEREDPFDALVVASNWNTSVRSIDQLPKGARVGTSSIRRSAQLRSTRPDVEIIELRGNVETRLRKLDEGNYDALILACAGLIRLGFTDRIMERIDSSIMLPAPGQGALAIESRVGDTSVSALLNSIEDPDTRLAVDAERAVLSALGGGCATPIATHANIDGERISIEALVASRSGDRVLRDSISGPSTRSIELAEDLAATLLERGAGELLEQTA
jgi:hydroxymethylbilane synthase